MRQRNKASLENYDIGDLRSDDSTDDDEAPRKKIPSWAQGLYTSESSCCLCVCVCVLVRFFGGRTFFICQKTLNHRLSK